MVPRNNAKTLSYTRMYGLIFIVMFVKFTHFFEHTSSREHFSAKREVVDTGSPGGHTGRGPGAIRAPWRACQALKVSCSAGVDKTISLASV